jgi:GNAT superfamily N-acetyltransferase
MGVVIRKVLPEEAYEYAVTHIACWQAAYRGIIPDGYLDNMSAGQIAERNRQILKEPGIYELYCMELNKKMMGRLVINKSRDEDKADAGEISAMYLLDAFWGKGYGRKMMEFSLAELKRRGHSEAILWVLEANSRARQFYEKCGFVFDGTKKEINNNKPLIEMRYCRTL